MPPASNGSRTNTASLDRRRSASPVGIYEGKLREEYNDALFRFVNEKGIDIIFCFSRRVYNSLPSLAKHTGEYEEIVKRDIFLHKKDGTPKKDYISHCVYLPDLSHKYTNVCLSKSLEVYGMLHPSGRYGFDPENYSEKLKALIDI